MSALRRLAARITPAEVLVAAGCLFTLLLLLHYVGVNGGNLPYLDEWYRVTDVAVATARGELTFDLLASQWNEHRPLVVNAITALLTVVTGWDISLQLYIHVGFAVVLYAAILGLVRVDLADAAARRRVTLYAALPIALLVFAVTKRQVWLWPYLLVWTQGLACFAVGLYAVRRLPVGWLGVIAVIAMAAMTTYSLIYGFAAWVLLGVAMWVRGYRKPVYYVPLIVAAVLVAFQFFVGFDWTKIGFSEEGHGSGIVRDPVRITYFILGNLGNPFFPFDVELAPRYIIGAVIAGIAGIGLLAANVAYVYRRMASTRPALWTWAIFAAFAAACVGVIALGRAGQVYDRPHYALAERYSQPAALLWVTLIVLGAFATHHLLTTPVRDRFAAVLLRINVIGLAVGVGFYTFAVTETAVLDPYVPPALTECAAEYPVTRDLDCLVPIMIPDRELLIERIAQLNAMTELRLSIWRDAPPPYTDLIALAERPFTVTRQAAEPPSVQYQTVGRSFAAMMLVLPATGQVEYALVLPTADAGAQITFHSAGLLDLDGIPQTATLDGVTFRVGVRPAGGSDAVVLYEQSFITSPDQRVLPILVDLTAYSGQQIGLILQTDGGEVTIDDRALWIDPRIEVRPQ